MKSFYYRQVNYELIKVLPEDLVPVVTEFMKGEPLDDTTFPKAIIGYSKGGAYRKAVIKIHGYIEDWNKTKVTKMSHDIARTWAELAFTFRTFESRIFTDTQTRNESNDRNTLMNELEQLSLYDYDSDDDDYFGYKMGF